MNSTIQLEAFIEHLPHAPIRYFIVWVRSQCSGCDQFHLNDAVISSPELVVLWTYRLGTRLAIRNCHEIQPLQPVQVHSSALGYKVLLCERRV